MKPDDKPLTPPPVPEKSRELLPPAKSVSGNHNENASASNLLVELAQCQRGILNLIQTTVSSLSSISTQVLPSVVFTLTGLIHATEMAAQKVLDEAEGLGADRDRLWKALTRLEPFVNTTDSVAQRAWTDAADCGRALSARVISIMSAMAFQDLTAQHLNAAIKTLEEVRERLLEALGPLDLPVEPTEPEPMKIAEKLSPPTSPAGARQALADQLWAEMRER